MRLSLLRSYTFWHTFLYVLGGTPKKEKASRRPSEGNGAAAAASVCAGVARLVYRGRQTLPDA